MNAEFHETKERLIQATVELLDELPLESISTVMILDRSGVSKGSMYHFFDDAADLFDAAFVRRFSALVQVSANYLKSIATESESREDFQQRLTTLTERSQLRSRASSRFERARMLARSERNNRFRYALAEMQQHLTDQFTDAIQIAQDKGWVGKKYEARTLAVFIQAYTLGRIVDDIVEREMNDEDWINLIHDFTAFVLSQN